MAVKPSVLIIYTGGTIGMVTNPRTGSLTPFDFSHIIDEMPELSKFDLELETIAFNPLIDSSDIQPEAWLQLAQMVYDNYARFTGFVVLHGTDTMSYTASALSFMLENQSKPVVFTGSQLPIGTLRTDGRENLITAIEIASATRNGQALVPEVCIYFQNRLFRGNRSRKQNAEYFNAFASDNYPTLANVGINIVYNFPSIYYPTHSKPLILHNKLDTNVAILKIFPGISSGIVSSILSISGLRGLILETYGSGNAPTADWFIEAIEKAVVSGLVIVNITQCTAGQVDMKKYDTGIRMLKAGVVGGFDSTTEAALTKLMFLLGQYPDSKIVKECMTVSVSGEISV
jgi:L-asparaginase